MLSEWLVEVPQNLSTDWLMTLCPVGKRSLVIASNGKTSAYARNGYCTNSCFPSHLPGGHRKQISNHGKDFTVLWTYVTISFKITAYCFFLGLTIIDCIFDEQKRIYYLLDVICWNGHNVCNSDVSLEFLIHFPM